jgi:Integrase core domain
VCGNTELPFDDLLHELDTHYSSLDQLQADLDSWLEQYNEHRPHSGKYCFGKAPMQTFLDSRHLAHEKELDRLAVVTLPDNISPRGARAAATVS